MGEQHEQDLDEGAKCRQVKLLLAEAIRILDALGSGVAAAHAQHALDVVILEFGSADS